MVVEVLDASNGRIVLDKVYLNGIHSLRRLSLRNTEQTEILVKLDSTFGDQLSFQLENENLPDLPTPLQQLATNTAAYASSGIASRNATNEMFNRVNLIDRLLIPPLETVSLVMLFAPDPPSKQSKRLSGGGGSDSGSSATTPSFAPGSADYFEIRGHEGTHVLQKMDGEIYFTVESPGQFNAHPKQTVVIKLSASICDSVLDTDIHDGGINFEDCIVGGTYSKYFTVRNRSEIDLYWSFELFDADEAAQWIKFMDADTLRPLDQESIPAFGSRRMRMVFRPTRPSKISQHLHIENVYNPDNTIEVPLHASVTSMHKEETLFLMSGSSIDFGDCVAGTWTRQVLVLKNVSSSLLEAHFKSIDPGDVRFQLQIDDDDEAPDGGIIATTPTTMTPGTMTPSDALPWGSNGILSELSRAPTQPLSLEGVDSVTSPMEFPTSPPMQQVKSFGQMLEAVSTDREPRSLDSASRATSRSSSPQRPQEGSMDLDDARSISTGSATTDGTSNTARRSEPRKTRMSREDHVTQIEELLMRPGQSYRIAVSYRPKAVDVTLDSKAGILVKKSFRLVIEYGLPASRGTIAPRESKTVHCRTRTCTSVISVSPSVIDFGETEVGTLQSMPLTIINESDMTAHVDMRFISKIINMYRNEIRIPPRQSLEVKVDIYPRKINPDYKKQITVVNLLNRANDQIVEVRSNNQDRTGITLHSLLYRILTPTGANFIDFGNLILNSATIRTFTIENLTDKRLVIDLTSTSPDEIVPYVKGEEDLDGDEREKDSELRANSSSSSSLSSLGSSLGSVRSEKDKLQMQPLSMLRPPNPADIKEKVLESIVGNDRDILSRRMASETSDKAASFNMEPEEPPPTPIKSSSGSHAVVSAAKQNQSSRDKMPSLPLKQKPIRKNSTQQQQQQNEELGGTEYLDLASSVQVGVDGRSNSSPPKQPKFGKDSNEKPHPGRLSLNGDALRKVKNGQRSPVATIRKWPPVPDESGCVSNAMPPLTGKQPSFRHHLFADFPDVSRLSLDQFLLTMEQHSTLKVGGRNEPLPSPPLKNASNAVNMEEKYVRSVMSLQRELAALIEAEAIVPVSRVVLGPRQDRKVIVVSRPLSSMRPHVQGLPRKQDARIFLRLTEFDADILNAAMTASAQPIVSKPEAIPVRKLMLRATMIRSIMELSQPHINFGYVDRSDRRTKTMLVQNRSEAPLLIAVRKSGSVSSSDLLLAHGAHFVIPGFGKKEVEFVFSPSLSGPFQEKMVVENVRDRENDQTVLVKAHVRKVHTFYVDSGLEVDFGSLSMGLQATFATSKSSHIIISNTSKINRVYEVHVESEELLFDLNGTALAGSHYLAMECLIEEVMSSGGARDTPLTKVEEEEVEHLEQKLKIAKRKGKDDKIKKLATRLGELGVGDGSLSAQASPVEPAIDSSPELDRAAAKASKHKFRRLGSSSVTFGLDAGQVKRLTVALRPQLCMKTKGQQVTTSRATALTDGCLEIVSRLVLHEHRNRDDAREVQLRVKVHLDGETVNNEMVEATLSLNAFSLRPGILDSQGQ